MAKNHHKVTNDEIEKFNLARQGFTLGGSQEFSREELKKELKKLGYSPNDNFLYAITNGINPPIVRISRGKYIFNKERIYITRLQVVWDNYLKRGNSSRYKKSMSISSDTVQVKDTLVEEKCKEYIEFLKEHGYRIQKKEVTVTWTEV